MTYYILQNYWWLIISVLGALLVFLLFVQGGQSMLVCARDQEQRTLMVNSLGRKWEFTFTTLVTFGGRFSPRSRCSTPRASAAPTGCGCSSCSALWCKL